MRRAKFNVPSREAGFPCKASIVEVVGEIKDFYTVYCPDINKKGHSAIHYNGRKFIGTKYERNLWHVHKDFLDIIEIPATLENK